MSPCQTCEPQLAACSAGKSDFLDRVFQGLRSTAACSGRSEGSCCALQFLSSINKQIVRGLSAADLKLEEAGLLPSVEQEKLPEEITDEDGNLLNDCAEVIPPGPLL